MTATSTTSVNRNDVFLDLLCADAVAAGFDYFASATREKDAAVLILVTEIAGKIIPVAQNGCGAVGVFPISQHDIRSASGQLAGRAARQAIAVFIRDDDFDVWNCATDGTPFPW